MKKTVYLDNNATTQVAQEVVEEMLPYFHDLYGNASSMHSFGGQVKGTIEAAREKVALLLGAQPDEIVVRPLPESGRSNKIDKAALRTALGVRDAGRA